MTFPWMSSGSQVHTQRPPSQQPGQMGMKKSGLTITKPKIPSTKLSHHFQSKYKGVLYANASNKICRAVPEAQTPWLHLWLRLEYWGEGGENYIDLLKSVKGPIHYPELLGTNTTNDIGVACQVLNE